MYTFQMRERTKLDPKAKKHIFISYSLQQKGYKCYNSMTRQMRVGKDVVFDEMSSWYASMKMREDVDERSDNVVQDVEQQSQVLSGGLGEFSNSVPNISPWTRRL